MIFFVAAAALVSERTDDAARVQGSVLGFAIYFLN